MVEKHHSLKHYRDHHYSAIDKAETYEELKDVALDILKNMPQPVGEVCGPASSGGLGSLEKNLAVIEKTINKLSDQGYHIFNWVPFEKRLQIIKNKTDAHPTEKNQMLLEGFYLQLFNSGLIKTFYFIHGWQSSHGANWERETAKKLGIEIIDLEKDFLGNE